MTSPLTVELAWGGTATAADVSEQLTAFTIPAGQADLEIEVSVLVDRQAEANETVALILKNAGKAQIGDPSTAGFTIRDLPAPISIVEVLSLIKQVTEHSSAKGRFEFRRSGNIEHASTIQLQFGCTAEPGRNYLRQSSILTVAPGVSRVVMTIPVFSDDEEEETAETVSVSILPGSSLVGPNSSASFKILDRKSESSNVISIAVSGRESRSNAPSVGRVLCKVETKLLGRPSPLFWKVKYEISPRHNYSLVAHRLGWCGGRGTLERKFLWPNPRSERPV